MKVDVPNTQRHLTGKRIQMADTEVLARYVFPFVDDAWSVPFYVIDAMTYGPRLFRGSLEIRAGGLHTPEPSSKLERVTALPTARFEEVVHFDPWWVFRGIAGIERAWIDAVLATNIAGTFNHDGTTYKLHDLEFDTGLRTLESLVAKDPLFRTGTFRKGDLGLLELRKPLRK
jgi:hypothetical protein